jgi:hypothetical protein
LKDYEDELLDAKENLLDPIKRFINGDQASIYESIRKIIDGDKSNFDYVDGAELEILRALIDHNKPYSGTLIREAKAAKDELSKKVIKRIEEEKNKALANIEHAITDLKSKEEFKSLAADKQSLIIQPFQEEVKKLNDTKYIAVIKDVSNKVRDHILARQLNEMIRLTTPVVTEGNEVNEPVPHYIRRSAIKVDFDKTELRTEEDVEEYVNALKKAYLEQIKNTKRISI